MENSLEISALLTTY